MGVLAGAIGDFFAGSAAADAGVAAADVGAAAAGADVAGTALTAADIAGGAAGLSDAAVAGDLAATAAMPAADAAFGGAAGLGAAGAADAAVPGAIDAATGMPTVDISATSLAGAPAASGGAGLAPFGLAAPGAASMLLPSGSAVQPAAASVDPAAQDAAPASADPGVVDPSQIGPPSDLAGSAPLALTPDQLTPAGDLMGDANAVGDPSGGGFWQNLGDWITQPKNALTAAELGLTGFSALQARQLPGAAKTALATAGPAAQSAQMTIATGGKGSPLWSAQKSAIDASIDAQIQNDTAAMQQTMASANMGGPNSGIVQEQIAEIKSQLETDRQELYSQALQQIVGNAVSELTGANQTLLSVAQMQMNEDRFALQLAAQGAQLAARLQQLSG